MIGSFILAWIQARKKEDEPTKIPRHTSLYLLEPLCLLMVLTICFLLLMKEWAVLFQMDGNPLSEFFVQSIAIDAEGTT